MIELYKHIEILLLDNDCVIVPGFGGFMAHHVDAVYIKEENCFLPPSRTLGFNPQLHINDSLLAQSYVEAYDISYPEALNCIAEEVRELKQTLEQCGSYEMPDIGVISLNSDGNYTFEPYASGILTPELYALSSFEENILDISYIKPNAADAFTPQNADFDKKDVINVNRSEEQPEDENDNTNKETAHVIKIDVNRLRNIAAAAIFLIMFVFTSMPIGDASKSNQVHCSIDTSILTRMMPQMQIMEDVELKPIKVINNNVVTTERTSEEDCIVQAEGKEVEIETKESFVIVLASKVTKTNAEAFINTLAKRGIQDAKVYSNNSGNKVVYGNFNTEEDAHNSLQELREDPTFKDAWIMKVND